MDLRIDSTGDLAIIDGELAFVTAGEAIRQHITMRLRTFLGESPYDRNAGVPYRTILLQPTTPQYARESILSAVILGTPGVTAAQVTVTLDQSTQTLRAAVKATARNAPITFEIEI